MKILTCAPDGGAYKYILDGISNALRAAGNAVTVSPQVVPNDFDLYLGCSGWPQKIPPKNQRKGLVGIHVNPYGSSKVGSVEGGPVIDDSAAAIKWTVDHQPDFVYCYCSDQFTPQYFGYWTSKHGIPVVGIPTAADILTYYPRQPEARFKCDVAWVGGRWPYKAITMDRYLPQLFKAYKSQVFGWGGWGNDGKTISDADVPILFASATVSPCVSEPHTVVHPVDLPERPFKAIASGGMVIHTPSPAITPTFGDTVPVPRDMQHWMDLVQHFIVHPDERNLRAAAQRQAVLANHTYFDRCMGIARVIKNPALEAALLQAKQTAIAAHTF